MRGLQSNLRSELSFSEHSFDQLTALPCQFREVTLSLVGFARFFVRVCDMRCNYSALICADCPASSVLFLASSLFSLSRGGIHVVDSPFVVLACANAMALPKWNPAVSVCYDDQLFRVVIRGKSL